MAILTPKNSKYSPRMGFSLRCKSNLERAIISGQQIWFGFQQAETDRQSWRSVAEILRKIQVSEPTFYR